MMDNSLNFIGDFDFGPDDCLRINKDLDTCDIKFMDAVKACNQLVKLLRKEPEEKFFHITGVAGHGMHFEKSHCILLNQFDAYKGFYKLFTVETEVRRWSDLCKNCYFVAIFATCREAFLHKVHCGCVEANSIAEAKQKFKKIEEEEKLKVVQLTGQEVIDALEKV